MKISEENMINNYHNIYNNDINDIGVNEYISSNNVNQVRFYNPDFINNPHFKESIVPKTTFISPNDIAMIEYIPQLLATEVYYSKIAGAELKIWDDLDIGNEILIQNKTKQLIHSLKKSIQWKLMENL